MMTVHEVSRITGLSVRTLQYYDKIGLLSPAGYTDSGYRLYDEESLIRLQEIMLLRELEFPLKDIKNIIEDPSYDRSGALDAQIGLLKLKRQHLDELIRHAENVRENGGKDMNFDAFDKSKIEEYAKEARKAWGHTPEYREYEQKTAGLTDDDMKLKANEMMEIFREFGKLRNGSPDSEEAGTLVKKLQNHITENYYKCSDEVLIGLGQMYAAGGDFTKNIDSAGGEGTAVFVNEAIRAYFK